MGIYSSQSRTSQSVENHLNCMEGGMVTWWWSPQCTKVLVFKPVQLLGGSGLCVWSLHVHVGFSGYSGFLPQSKVRIHVAKGATIYIFLHLKLKFNWLATCKNIGHIFSYISILVIAVWLYLMADSYCIDQCMDWLRQWDLQSFKILQPGDCCLFPVGNEKSKLIYFMLI